MRFPRRSQRIADEQEDTTDAYSIFSEATERKLFRFDGEIMKSRAYREVYSSVRNSQSAQHAKRRSPELIANLLDDDDLIELAEYPSLTAAYSEELRKEMMSGQTHESSGIAVVGPDSAVATEEENTSKKRSIKDIGTLNFRLEQPSGRSSQVADKPPECFHEDTNPQISGASTRHSQASSEVAEDPSEGLHEDASALVPCDSNQSDKALKAASTQATTMVEKTSPASTVRARDPIVIGESENSTYNSLEKASASGHSHDVFKILIRLRVADAAFLNVALLHAALNGHVSVIEILLFRDANVNCVYGRCVKLCGGQHVQLSPLHFAAANDHGSMIECLLDHGADINVKNGADWTPLHVAAARGCISAVEVLLKRGAGLEDKAHLIGGEMTSMIPLSEGRDVAVLTRKNSNDYLRIGCTPLYLAAVFGWFETVRILIENGAGKDVKASCGLTSLYAASREFGILHAASGEFGILTPIFRSELPLLGDLGPYVGKDESASQSGSRLPPQALNTLDRVLLLEFLVQNGYDPQKADGWGFTPLHLACLQDKLDVLRTLLRLTPDVSTISATGWMPLHLAVLSLDISKAELILEAGGEVNASSKPLISYFENPSSLTGLTPLGLAVVLGNHPMTCFLLQKGASIELPGSKLNVLHLAAMNNRTSGLVLLAKQGVGWKRSLTALDVPVPQGTIDEEHLPLNLRIDINSPYGTGLTPLLQYVLKEQPEPEVVQVMLDLNADVKARDADGQSVLHSLEMNLVVAIVLINAGADLEARTTSGYTPLLKAASDGHSKCFRLLIDLGADIYAKDNSGRSAWKILSDCSAPNIYERTGYAIGKLSLSAFRLGKPSREMKMLNDAKKTRPPPKGWEE